MQPESMTSSTDVVTTASSVLTRELLYAIRDQYRCDWWGYHGVRHWARVRANTRLFRLTEPVEVSGQSIHFYPGLRLHIDQVVCDLFAVFHDACRVNEHDDPGHGARGAALARRLHGRYFQISDEQMDQLVHACVHHTDGLRDGPPTVQACWDADRCDLPRVGIEIDPRRLCHPISTAHPAWQRMVKRSEGEWTHQHSRSLKRFRRRHESQMTGPRSRIGL